MEVKFDLHIHSKYSHDSKIKIEAILRRAKLIGLDGIAITDHDSFEGAEIAEKIAKKNFPDLFVIKGEEISTDAGDIIGLFLNKQIKPGKILDILRQIKKQNGIIVLPHPALYHIIENDLVKKIDAVEVFNGRVGAEANKMALELAKKYKKSIVGGSDAHLAFEIGNGQTILSVKEINERSIRKSLRKGRVYGKKMNLAKKGTIFLIKLWRRYVG